MSIPMLNLPLKTAKPAHRLRKGKVKAGLGVGALQFRTETPKNPLTTVADQETPRAGLLPKVTSFLPQVISSLSLST